MSADPEYVDGIYPAGIGVLDVDEDVTDDATVAGAVNELRIVSPDERARAHEFIDSDTVARVCESDRHEFEQNPASEGFFRPYEPGELPLPFDSRPAELAHTWVVPVVLVTPIARGARRRELFWISEDDLIRHGGDPRKAQQL